VSKSLENGLAWGRLVHRGWRGGRWGVDRGIGIGGQSLCKRLACRVGNDPNVIAGHQVSEVRHVAHLAAGRPENRDKRCMRRLSPGRATLQVLSSLLGVSMTGEQSRLLKVGDRVRWGATTTDFGTVVETAWNGVTIDWDDGNRSSIQHNDMARVERVPAN